MSFIFWLFQIKKSKCNRPIQLASGFFFFFLLTMNNTELLILWNVERFDEYLKASEHEVYPLIVSPTFAYKNTNWMLNLYPEGLGDPASHDYLSLFIKYVSEEPDTLSARVELAVLNRHNERLYARDTGDHQYHTFIDFGYKQFMKLSEIRERRDEILTPSGSLKIFARIEFEHAQLATSLAWSNYDLLLFKENMSELYENQCMCDLLIRVVQSAPTPSQHQHQQLQRDETSEDEAVSADDVPLVCGRTITPGSSSVLEIKAHKFVLAARSTKFRQLIAHSLIKLKRKTLSSPSSSKATSNRSSSPSGSSVSPASASSFSPSSTSSSSASSSSSPSCSSAASQQTASSSPYAGSSSSFASTYSPQATTTHGSEATTTTGASSSASASASCSGCSCSLNNAKHQQASASLNSLSNTNNKSNDILTTSYVATSSSSTSSTSSSSSSPNKSSLNNQASATTPVKHTAAAAASSLDASSTSLNQQQQQQTQQRCCHCLSNINNNNNSNSGVQNEAGEDDDDEDKWNSVTSMSRTAAFAADDDSNASGDTSIVDMLVIRTSRPAQCIEHLVRFMYACHVESLDGHAKHMYDVAREYGVHGLTSVAREAMGKELSVLNCCDYLVFSVVNNDYELNAKVQSFINTHGKTIARTLAYKRAKRKYPELFGNAFGDVHKRPRLSNSTSSATTSSASSSSLV